mgnify:FL=1
MNVPKLRFKEFNDEWINNCLSDIATITMGQSPSSKNYTSNKNDIILIQGNADLNNGHVVPRIFTTQITKTCNINDIIMTVRAPVGDTAISYYNACIGRGVCAISGDKYIYHYLNYLKINDYWKKISKGSTIDSITSNDIRNLNINFPNSTETKKIVKTLDLLDKKIFLQTKKIEDLKLFKLCNYDNLFSNQTHEVQLKNISKIEKGKQLNNELLIENGSYYMLNGGVSPSGYTNEYNANENTITISEGGNSCGYVNFNKNKFWCGGHCYKVIPNGINNNYLYHNLKYNEKKIMDLRVGSGLPNIQKKDIENFKISIHNENEQLKISNYFDRYDLKIELEELKLNKLIELKKGLMQNMFV